MSLDTSKISHPALRQLVLLEYLHSCEDSSLREEFIEKLEKEILERTKELSGKILSQIKGLSSRFILLIGNDDDLLEAIGSYIYCTKGKNDLYYHSFMGETEKCLEEVLNNVEVYHKDTAISKVEKTSHGLKYSIVSSKGLKRIEGNLIEHVRHGRSVFLGDLEYPNSLLLKHTAKLIKGIKNEWLEKDNGEGLLMVSARQENDLPNFFVEQFEVVSLCESKNQDISQVKIPRGIKQSYAKKEEFEKFLREIKGKHKNTSLDKMVNVVISQMEGRKLLLDDKGRSIYKKSTLKRCYQSLDK